MFGLKFKTDSNNIKSIAEGITLPPLILDPVWLSLFPKDHKNSKITHYEKRLRELMKEESRLREKKKNIALLKRRDMGRIMELTVDVHEKKDTRAKQEMQTKRRNIIESNSAYKLIDQKISRVAGEIEAVNKRLLAETVSICYNLMKSSKDEIDTMSPQIEMLRKQLHALVDKKTVAEEYYLNTYNLLHKLVGGEILNELDRENSYREKKRWFWE